MHAVVALVDVLFAVYRHFPVQGAAESIFGRILWFPNDFLGPLRGYRFSQPEKIVLLGLGEILPAVTWGFMVAGFAHALGAFRPRVRPET